jgi:hypothetical protein
LIVSKQLYLLNRKTKNAAPNIAADLQCYPKRGNYNPTNLEQSKSAKSAGGPYLISSGIKTIQTTTYG